jgi:LmbE family N-acetylglucosaminyl deacetylase
MLRVLLLVHAHPDDESILTGGVIARAHLEGHRVVLVTATRGEGGAAHHQGEEAARSRLAAVRSEELRKACAVLGVDRQEFLGYRDSGSNGAAGDGDPRSFHTAPLAEAGGRLARILRQERPDVVVTYAADGTYGHPDHLKAHAVTLTALDLVAAEGWQPTKVYGHGFPRSVVLTILEAARTSGVPLPEGIGSVQGVPDHEITTQVDVNDVLDRKLSACVMHASQMDPGIPLAVMAAQAFEAAFAMERFVLLRGILGEERPEPSLFAGLA